MALVVFAPTLFFLKLENMALEFVDMLLLLAELLFQLAETVVVEDQVSKVNECSGT